MQTAMRWSWMIAAWLLILAMPGTAGTAQARVRSTPELPPSLMHALTWGMQGNLPPPYRPQPVPEGFVAENPSHRMELTFKGAGPEVTGAEDDWRLQMTLVRYGRAGALKHAPSALVVLNNDRVEYRRGPTLTEWYLNTPLGLEQGFTFTKRLPNPGSNPLPLTLEICLPGTVQPVMEGENQSTGTGAKLLLQDAVGRTLARYTGLCTCDADGKVLPSRLAFAGETLLILVDDRDARYPIVIDPWLQKTKLTATDGAAGDSFGFSVAIDGDTAAVGGRFAGAAWVFDKTGNSWTQLAKLLPDNPVGGFGSAVAISGDTVVVGQPDNNMAHVFVKPVSGWQDMTQTATLTPDDGDDKGLGCSVGISGDTVVAGAHNDDVGLNNNQGSAYVFVRPGGGWADMTQTAKLTASDGEEGDEFGYSVAISGDTIVVGAYKADFQPPASTEVTDAGGAYVFVKPGSGWADMTETVRVRPYTVGAYAQFGNAVAISGDTVVVGDWLSDYPNGINTGSAHVYTKPATGWTDAKFEDALLTHQNAAPYDAFGVSVAVSGDTVVVGADEGLAFVFEKPPSGWGSAPGITDMTETAELKGTGREVDDYFGSAVAVSGDTALVGARGDDVGDNANQGSVYVFSTEGTTPVALQILLLEDE